MHPTIDGIQKKTNWYENLSTPQIYIAVMDMYIMKTSSGEDGVRRIADNFTAYLYILKSQWEEREHGSDLTELEIQV